MFLGPLMHREDTFELPYAGGCDLGTRTVEPHMAALRRFGLEVKATEGSYHATVDRAVAPTRPIVLTERGDTVTENALLAAARHDGVTVIRNASPNYMVQDLCFFLDEARRADRRHRHHHADRARRAATSTCDVDYAPSEDPIEAMSLLAAAIVTESEITIRRVPIEFLEIELALLEEMGFRYDRSDGVPRRQRAHPAGRPHHRHVSELHAPIDKIHPMPFPGLNIDNLPFFAVIAAAAEGQTLLHDWVYENRAIYLTELNKLGASVKLLDPHRVLIEGPTRWRGAEMICPPALRPAVVILLAMLAAKGTSVLRSVYVINRGYEDLAERLNALGARSRPSATSDARSVGRAGAVLALETRRSTLACHRRSVCRADHCATSRLRSAAVEPTALDLNQRSGSAEEGLDVGAGTGRRRRGRGHVGGDPRQRLRLGAAVAVPVVLGLDQVAEVGALEEDALARRALVHGDVAEVARGHRGLALRAGHLLAACSDGTPAPARPQLSRNADVPRRDSRPAWSACAAAYCIA